MSNVYSVTFNFIAESDKQAERIRSDLMDYLLSRDVCDLAVVLPFRKLDEQEAQALLEDAPTDEEWER